MDCGVSRGCSIMFRNIRVEVTGRWSPVFIEAGTRTEVLLNEVTMSIDVDIAERGHNVH